MEQVSGKVYAVSHSSGGIRIGDVWYNAKTEEMRKSVTFVNKGDMVELGVDDKKEIQSVKITSKSITNQTPTKKTTEATDDMKLMNSAKVVGMVNSGAKLSEEEIAIKAKRLNELLWKEG